MKQYDPGFIYIVTVPRLVSHSFVFVYKREFGYYILLGACRNEGNHCETTQDN